MASANPTNNVRREDIFQSFQAFQARMKELEQTLNAREALATVEFINDYTKTQNYRESLKKLPQEKLIESIAQYSRSHPGHSPKYHALNEATIVLLSAYLEGFIEELHEKAMHQLLDERIKSSGVLVLLDYAHKHFKNPAPDKIIDLFNTCGIRDIISCLKVADKGKISEFVRIRNRIAHGERVHVAGQEVETWVKLIERFAEELSSVVREEISSMR